MNCLLSAAGYGDYEVICLTLSHGIEVIAGAPDQARDHRAFYISRRTSSRFTVGITFTTYDEYAKFGAWMQGYGKQATTPNTPVGAMRVMVPARNFDRVGVPVRGISFGDTVGSITHPVSLQFDGARESGDFSSPIVSSFENPTTDVESGKFFYPAGTQLSGSGAAADSLYDLPPGTTLIQDGFRKLAAAFGGGTSQNQEQGEASKGRDIRRRGWLG